jgi:DNA-binding MarR family transcriptional regulator
MSLENQFVLVQFAEAKQPEYVEKKGEGWVGYGHRNDYPNYLVELFNKSAKHNSIVKSKVHYVCGNGWVGNQAFIDQVNRTESLDDLTRKVSMDIEIFGGAYMEVIWGLNKVAEIWHIDYTKIRTNKDNTQFWYKEEWKDNKEKYKVYPAFNPKNPQGSQILYVKEYRPYTQVYALPGYFGALNYIESDIEVSKHVLGNAKTGFSASKLITLPNGEPSPDEQSVIHRKFKNTYTGADGIKYMLSFVNDASRKPIIDDLGQSDLTKEDFANVDSLIQTNIFSGHQITTPSIFGIAEAGKLGSRTEMRDGYEIFKNTYVNAKQMFLESTFNMLAKYAGYNEEMKIVPTEPVGIDLSETALLQIMSKDELREKIGLQPIEVNQTATNQDVIDAINSLSPLVANKVLEQLTPNELRSLISLQPKEGGEDIVQDSVQQSVQMSEQFDFSALDEFGENADNFNILKQRAYFQETQLFEDVSQLQSNILDLITKDKRITPEVIAEVLKEDVGAVKRVIGILEEKGYITSKETSIGKGDDKSIIIERKLTAPISEIVESMKPKTTEFLIRYSYEWRQGFNDSDLSTSREFCQYFVTTEKMYSRSEIEAMSARLGYDVFSRGGGWYTIPDTNRHRPFCRHQWKANVVTRK